MDLIFRGGSYVSTQGTTERGTESHHLISQEAIKAILEAFLKLREGPEWEKELNRFLKILPSVEMLKEDHLKTFSHMNNANGRWYRPEQCALFQAGQIDRIWGKELALFEREFPDGKYNRAIVQAERQLLLVEKELVRLDDRFRLDPEFKRKLEDRVKLQDAVELKEKELEKLVLERTNIFKAESRDLQKLEELRNKIGKTAEERDSIRSEYDFLKEKIREDRQDLQKVQAEEKVLKDAITDLENKRDASLKLHVDDLKQRETLYPPLDKDALKTELKEIKRQAEINPWPYTPERLLSDPSIKKIDSWQLIGKDKVCFFGEREVVQREGLEVERYNWTILIPPGGISMPSQNLPDGPLQSLRAAKAQEELWNQDYRPIQVTFGEGKQETVRTLWMHPDNRVTSQDLSKEQVEQLRQMPPPIVADVDNVRHVELKKQRSNEPKYLGYVCVSFCFTIDGQRYDNREVWIKPEQRLSFNPEDLNSKQRGELMKSAGPFQLDYLPQKITLLTPSFEGGIKLARIEQLRKEGYLEVPISLTLLSRPGEQFERSIWVRSGERVNKHELTGVQCRKLIDQEGPVVLRVSERLEQQGLQRKGHLQQELERSQEIYRSRNLGR